MFLLFKCILLGSLLLIFLSFYLKMCHVYAHPFGLFLTLYWDDFIWVRYLLERGVEGPECRLEQPPAARQRYCRQILLYRTRHLGTQGLSDVWEPHLIEVIVPRQ